MKARGAFVALLLVCAAEGRAQTPPPINVCWGYGCDHSARVLLPRQDWQAIRDLMTPSAPDPARERARVARAIARFERAAGAATGTDEDQGGNLAGSGRPGQQDCIDESRNTTGYLQVLAERGLLRWHDVGARQRRAKWILDQHWTAVLVERDTGRRWAVDSWFLDNGRRPYIQALDAWLDKDPLPPNPDEPQAAPD